MALATQCPHCHTTFRVAADQLKLRGGIVRCGTCNEVFDGNAALIDLDAPPRPAPAPEAEPDIPDTPDIEPAEVAEIEAREEQPADETQVYPLDFDATFDSPENMPVVAEPEPTVEPASKPVIDEHGPLPLLRQAAVVSEPEAAPLVTTGKASPKGKSTSKSKAAVRMKIAAPEPAPPPPPPENDEPEFVKRGRELERTGSKRRIGMIAGSVLLVLALLVQGVTTFRNGLSARFPGMAPSIASLCGALDCRIELPAQIDSLSIETGELQTVGANTFSLVTLLRNQSTLTQAWPYIELELTDAVDKPLLRRVFTPAEYLPQGVSAAKGFGARSEQPVTLYFELKQLKASGYHIAVFYP